MNNDMTCGCFWTQLVRHIGRLYFSLPVFRHSGSLHVSFILASAKGSKPNHAGHLRLALMSASMQRLSQPAIDSLISRFVIEAPRVQTIPCSVLLASGRSAAIVL